MNRACFLNALNAFLGDNVLFIDCENPVISRIFQKAPYAHLDHGTDSSVWESRKAGMLCGFLLLKCIFLLVLPIIKKVGG